tara:strand:+ start:244 stop:756 length:513 start_codon:yes stop_codon:yes gene_type:complete
VRIRPAIRRDLDQLEDVEDDAGALFQTLGFDFSNVAPASRQSRYWDAFDDGIIMVAEVPPAGVAGFIAIAPLDDGAHILELSVRRASQKRGLGGRLMAAAETWAREQGFPALTLTTFRDVPWNAPFYARLGFAEVAVDAERPGLQDERAREIARNLDDVAPRLAMRKALQ